MPRTDTNVPQLIPSEAGTSGVIMATVAHTSRSASSPSEASQGVPSTGAFSPGGLPPAVVTMARNTPDSSCRTKERIESTESSINHQAKSPNPAFSALNFGGQVHRRRRDTDQLVFHESKGDVLFACIVPVVLGLLGLALIYVISLPEQNFLICRMRSKDLWEDVVTPATQFCTHLVLTLWGDDLDERDRSQQEFFKSALNRTRLYLTVPPEDCPRTSLTDLSTRLMSLHLDGFEFYMKGNESADDVKACFDLIDRFVSLKGPNAAILRSGPYGTLVKPNVLANVYQLHAPVNNSGQIPDAIFVNNFNYTNPIQGAVRTVSINEFLIRAQKERAASITKGSPNVTNICYSLSFMGIRLDTRMAVKYSKVCETVQCCLVDKLQQRHSRSRSLVATADDFGGKCSGRKAPLLTKVAELARSHNSAFMSDTSGSAGKTIVADSADVIPLLKPEFPIEIFL
ncbi:hypothetical protein HPB49_011564 [Dermacentor silvarum]|uniref:Uncharacterized protein n=1 Tax=Dermacentor silvarum TaxID=543639 RepID=A0ACB8C3M7_DERSI|nr:hypothetical protein HPB49_011564 [Dermacentor silvarum]